MMKLLYCDMSVSNKYIVQNQFCVMNWVFSFYNNIRVNNICQPAITLDKEKGILLQEVE